MKVFYPELLSLAVTELYTPLFFPAWTPVIIWFQCRSTDSSWCTTPRFEPARRHMSSNSAALWILKWFYGNHFPTSTCSNLSRACYWLYVLLEKENKKVGKEQRYFCCYTFLQPVETTQTTVLCWLSPPPQNLKRKLKSPVAAVRVVIQEARKSTVWFFSISVILCNITVWLVSIRQVYRSFY